VILARNDTGRPQLEPGLVSFNTTFFPAPTALLIVLVPNVISKSHVISMFTRGYSQWNGERNVPVQSIEAAYLAASQRHGETNHLWYAHIVKLATAYRLRTPFPCVLQIYFSPESSMKAHHNTQQTTTVADQCCYIGLTSGSALTHHAQSPRCSPDPLASMQFVSL
jgi:hypothetical protein